jgi:serine/threonine-protein kinase
MRPLALLQALVRRIGNALGFGAAADPNGQSSPRDPPPAPPQDLASLAANRSRPSVPAASPASPAPPPPARVTLTLVGGGKGQQFVFEERTTCIVGRQDECRPRFPNDDDHRTISRHHCLLDINPPDILVRDLGSKFGTYVNGELLDKRPDDMGRDEALKQRFRERPLKDGDELRLCEQGTAVFRVAVAAPTACADCGAWIPDDRKADCQRAAGVYQCAACRARAEAERRPRRARVCALCGRDIAAEAGANRPGALLCAECRKDHGRFLRGSPEAGGGAGDAIVIQGYTIFMELGRGAMGSVWLARHEQTGRLAAVKVMLPQVAADERAVQRFLQEMANSRLLNHPNVVRVEDAGFSRGVFFLTLEYCDGGSAVRLMKQRGGVLSVDEAVGIIRQALEGLHYAHNLFGPGSGLVHRDFKPANLLLSGEGGARVAKVGDYGLSKAFDDAGLSGLTRTGEKAGTVGFMARQQVIDFKYAGPEVDVWAAAASLYYLLTGVAPRDFPRDRDPLLVVLETPPVPIRRRKPSLPNRLAEVIDRALVEEPEIAFQTAAAFKEALEGAL